MAGYLATDDGCAIVAQETTTEADGDGFLEHTRFEARSEDGACRWVGVELPPVADLVDLRARLHLSDDTNRKLPDSRLAIEAVGQGLDRLARIAVPELLRGDVVRVEVTRRWTVGAVWTPEQLASSALPEGPVTVGEPPAPIGRRDLTFAIPDGDVQAALYPGGSASAAVVDTIELPAASGRRAFVWALPRDVRDATAVAEVGAPEVLRVVAGGVLVAQAASGEAERVVVRYTLPDPPACDEVRAPPGVTFDWDASDPAGFVQASNAFYTLVSHGEQRVMPDRAAIARGLRWRFDRLALPEPALPLELKHHRKDLELLTLLRPALWRRARVAELPGDPLFPRKLYAARKSEVVTPIEAALIVRLYALQAGFPAEVVLVRPADRGPGDEVCPVGHDQALVHAWFEDQERWIDPGCPSCAPFEVRPELLGASAFDEHLDVTPPPPRGTRAVRVEGTRATWTLDGPEALLLRLALEDVGPAERERVIAERYGGPGAHLVDVTGLADAGGVVTLAIDAPSGGFPELLGPSWRATGTDTWWVDAPGLYSVERATVDETPADVTIGDLHYTRTVDAGRVVESLDVASRTVSAADLAALDAARRAR